MFARISLQKIITVNFAISLFAGILAFVFFLLIPPDPKNAWLFGYSKIRVGLGVMMLVIIGTFARLTIKSRKKPLWMAWIVNLGSACARDCRWSFSIFWTAYMVLSVGLYLYFVFNSPYTSVLLRLSPLVVFVAVCAIQILSLFFIFVSRLPTEDTGSKDNEIKITLKSKKVAFVLTALMGLILLASINVEIIDHLIQPERFYRYAVKFYLDGEQNIPTYFSTFMLLFSATLLGVIATLGRKMVRPYTNHWYLLSIIFFFLSLDETAGLHELVTKPLRFYLVDMGIDLPKILYFAWIIPAILLLIIFTVAYLRFFLHLPTASKAQFFVAATLYIGGAIGVEMIGGRYDALYDISDYSNLTYNLIASTEETLEMLGVIVFIYALLEYIQTHFQGQHLHIE